MTNDSASIVSKVWNYAHVLKNAGVGYGDYVEQITRSNRLRQSTLASAFFGSLPTT